MTLVVGVLAAALAVALASTVVLQRRSAQRLLLAGRRLGGDLAPPTGSLAQATSAIERIVDRAILEGGAGSVAEARLASALAVMPQGVVVFDETGLIVQGSEIATGYLAARHGDALVEEAITELAAAAARSEGRLERTVELFGPPRRTLVLAAASLAQGARPLGVLVVIDDVTDRRRLEAVRTDFVANISHELKTPVGALGLLAETLLAEDDPLVTRRMADRMLHEAFRVGRTIDDLLELSRIEVDEPATRDEVAIGGIITEAVDRVAPAAEQQGISIEVGAAAGALSVAGDHRQLVSAVFNLLDNAVKYSDVGSTVHVAATASDGWVDLSVQDHGLGIPRRDLERVFERFYRVDRARSRATGGTGLGLAIVRHIAGNHAGDVRVESTEGEGSTFTLRLPASSVTELGAR